MRLTPLDIHHKEFRRAIRGYSEEDVDVFLDEVAEEFELLFKENTEQKERLEKINEKLKQYENIEQTLQNTLLTAQKSAEELQSNAKKEGELIIRDAELKSKEIIQESMNEKRKVQNALNILKQAEEEFRMRFKSLLESYLNVLSETGGVEEIESKMKGLMEFKKESLIVESSELAAEEFVEEGKMASEQLSEEPIVIDEEPEEVSEALAKVVQEEEVEETETREKESRKANKKKDEETEGENDDKEITKNKGKRKDVEIEIPTFLKEGPRKDFLKGKEEEIEEIS